MAEYRVPLQYVFGRTYADGSGMQPATAEGVSVFIGLLDATLAGGYQVALDIPRWAQLTDVSLFFSGGYTGLLRTIQGRSDWSQSAVAVGSFLANGVIAFDDDSRNRFRVGGAAAATTAVNGTGLQVVAKWKLGVAGGVGTIAVPSASGAALPQTSSAVFAEFGDDATGDDPPAGDLSGLFQRLEDQSNLRGGGGAEVTLTGRPVQVTLANLVHPQAWGRVFLTSADLGAGNGQIPTSRSLWQGAQFRNHPQVFVRLGDNVRQVATATRFGASDVIPITSSPAMFRLYTVDRRPEYSSWLCVVDGMPLTLTFQHPDSIDARRPVDIWNRIVAPAITARSGYAADTDNAITYEAQPGVGIFDLAAPVFPTPVFRRRGALPRRLGYLQYARLLELWDTEGSPYDDPPYTEIPTTT